MSTRAVSVMGTCGLYTRILCFPEINKHDRIEKCYVVKTDAHTDLPMTKLRIRYHTYEFGDEDIHVRSLRDNQQFEDKHGKAEEAGISSALWPLFGVVWPSGEVLAHLMTDFDIAGKRILEVGCGIGLTSLVLNQRNADITATDYHPEAAGFLELNTELNQERTIPFVQTDWQAKSDALGKFDLVLGSDLLYETEHIELLSEFIHRHTKSQCEVIIVDPGRQQHARFSKKMIKLGYSHSQSRPENTTYLDKPFKGQILRYSR